MMSTPYRRLHRGSVTPQLSTASPISALLDRVRANVALALVVAGVCATGLALTIAAVLTADIGGTEIVGVIALTAAAGLAEALPVPVVGVGPGATSLANIFIVAAVAVYSWQAGVVVAVAAMLAGEIAAPRAFVRAAYNVSLYACSAAAAGAVIALVNDSTDVALGVAAVFGSAAFYVVDVSLLAGVIAASRRVSPGRVVYDFARSTVAPFVTMATTTAVLVFVWEESPVATIFLVPPLVTIVLYQRRLHASLERQRELDRMKDEFVAVVSHELRTPLASVYGGVETLQRDDLTAEQRAALLAVVRTEGARLARLVDDVLWVSRMRTPAQEAARGRCDATEIVEKVVAAAATTAPPATTVCAVTDGPAPAAVDEDQLTRVVQNLVENAVKYSPDGGDVVVTCSAADGTIRIDVADEGIGIPPDQRDAIFEKFSRLDPQMGRGIGGTGLGLYICHELVRQMDGTIGVGDNPGGRGSVFTVRVPQLDSEGT